MNPGADVHAIDALEDWHGALCLFREEGIDALNSIGMEVRRAFDWIAEEAKGWHREAREAQDALVQAKAELAQRKTPDYSGRVPDASVQEENLARAKNRLRFAEDQEEICRKWLSRLSKMVNEEYEGTERRLMNFMETELPAAIAHLNAQISSLHAYTDVKPGAPAPEEQQ